MSRTRISAALERRHDEGLSLDVNSVASFFVSRVDTDVDQRFEQLGRSPIWPGPRRSRTRARRTCAFKELFSGRALGCVGGRGRGGAAAAMGFDRHQEPALLGHACMSTG